MSKVALVSTVDSMPGFPEHEVLVFDTETEAIRCAVALIVKNDSDVSYIEDECVWTMGEEHYENPEDLLEAWQDTLSPTEYFHIMPVRSGDPQITEAS